MLESYPWLSVIPPIAAVIIAIKFRQVYFALFLGLWSGTTIIAQGNILKGLIEAIERCTQVFSSPDNTKTIIFCILIGALIAFAQRSGGMQGFIHLLSRKNIISSRRRAQFLSVAIGASIPIESSTNLLVNGTISRPIYDKLRISREKLAYICDSMAAPICTLIPINAWGAYVAGLLSEQGIQKPFKVYLLAIPLNFYALFAILLAVILISTQKDFFAMAKAEKRAREEGKSLRDGAIPLISSDVTSINPKENIKHRASDMVLPVSTMIVMMLVGMLITGKGDITAGSGSTSVLWAVLAAIFVAGLKYKFTKIMTFQEEVDLFFKGVGGLIPIAFLVVLAFALGRLCLDIQTGAYVASITKHVISPQFIPLILFLVSAFISFAIGTSWGTWALMIPIGIGLAQALDMNILPVFASMMSGGVFGDHCSPISDTTIVASMASASDHIDHVNTQLPYALTAGFASAIMFLVMGFLFYS